MVDIRKVSMVGVTFSIVLCGVVHSNLGSSSFFVLCPKMISQNVWTVWI